MDLNSSEEMEIELDELLCATVTDEEGGLRICSPSKSKPRLDVKKTKRQPKQIKVIPFVQALDKLNQILESIPSLEHNDMGTSQLSQRKPASRKKGRPTMKLKSDEWDAVCLAVEREAISSGLNAANLEKIWNLLSNPAANVADKYVSKLLFTMIPRESKIPGSRIREIISHISRFSHKSKASALKYLTGLFDYNLCEKKTFNEYDSYCRIFFGGRSNDMIPWVCALLKRISTPELLSKSFVNDMLDLVSKPSIYTKAPILKVVIEVLRFFKGLRPELIPQNIYEFPVRATKKPLFEDHFRSALFNAKRRLLGRDDASKDMEIAPNDFEKVHNFLHVLNENCFPEFLLHRIADPPPDDYTRILKMSKYNQMRCALKTTESLPFIVNDPELYECFNNFVSLILQNRFDNLDTDDEARHKFIFRRIWEVTVMCRRGLPAANEWLLDFMRIWDGHLYKFEIFQLLEWLPPVHFSDGFIYVLQKLEMLFLYGEHRLQVWLILKKLVLDWMLDLQSATEDDDGTVNSLKEAIVYLLEFIENLVGLLASQDGHRDINFLVHCCDTYAELNCSIALTKNQPFYIYPPYHLWVMVVLSNSLVVMDSFCSFMCKATPRRSLPHLKNTTYQKKYQSWNADVVQEVFRYFVFVSPDGTDNPVFPSIFSIELNKLDIIVEAGRTPKGDFTMLGQSAKSKTDELMNDLSTFSALRSEALNPILLDAEKRGKDFGSSLDKNKAQTQAPNILKWCIHMTQVLQNGTKKQL